MRTWPSGSPRAAGSTSRTRLASSPATILNPPLPGLLARLPLDPRAYGWTLWPAIGLLPPAVREGYRLRWGWRERLVADWLVAGWRAWNPLLPAAFRQMPQALAADRRVGQ